MVQGYTRKSAVNRFIMSVNAIIPQPQQSLFFSAIMASILLFLPSDPKTPSSGSLPAGCPAGWQLTMGFDVVRKS